MPGGQTPATRVTDEMFIISRKWLSSEIFSLDIILPSNSYYFLVLQCIELNHDDDIVGGVSKANSHKFSKDQPRGVLHRAFSVFLFNSKNELLLQQRASSKITFPDVWTNTCCSHPLYDNIEIDKPEQVADYSVPGVKHAAIRKLEHELGIPASSLKVSQFKFLTRLHYWAADVVTHGPKSEWGEHEIDYILFIKADVKCKPDPDEVKDIKYVTLEGLQKMMKPSSGLLWSPWFRIIAEKFLVHWWSDLDVTINTDKFNDNMIHRFDPSSEHMGGAGNASTWLGTATYNPSKSSSKAVAVGDASKKQGAYGKVKTHSHSKLEQLMRVDEVFAALRFKIIGMPNKVDRKNENYKFCDDILVSVSRSFAAVIKQLPKGLCIDILVFYLALRALDTIEDDMEAFKGKESEKINHLNNFYRTGLVTDGWSMDGVGKEDEKKLLQEYYKVVAVFKDLSPASQEVIADITKRMGEGMAFYVGKDLGQGTVTLQDYYKYCHYVAGLVGEGLSRLFACTGYESVEVSNVSTTLANTMGLFLQKTNIIRDYLEDYVDGRAFWPQEIWKKYSVSGDLGDFASPNNLNKALHCLNHLVMDALECVPECLQYMDLLKTEEVFRFCAIPQVMAIATLNELYDNPNVFTGVVKIRKFAAAQLILDTQTITGLHKWFYVMAKRILKKVPSSDPNAARTVAICEKIIELTQENGSKGVFSAYLGALSLFAPVPVAVATSLIIQRKKVDIAHIDFSSFSENEPYDYMLYAILIGSGLMVLFSSAIQALTPSLKRADP